MKICTAVLFALLLVAALLALNLVIFWPPERQSATDTALSPAVVEPPAVGNPVMKYGYPGTAMLRYRDGYVLSYDARNRVPFWVCEHLDAENLKGRASRKKSGFKADTTIPDEFRSSNKDYEGSGFDRGHMAPAGDNKSGQEAMDETFLLSNMSPQVGEGFNRDYWNAVEQQVRDWARERELYVYTGPLYLPEETSGGKRYVRYQVIGKDLVAVPTHFFKVVLAESGRGVEVLALVLPNRSIPADTQLRKFIVSVDDLEKMSGLDFLDVMDDRAEDRIEKARPSDVW